VQNLKHRIRLGYRFALVGLCMALAACSSLTRKSAVPENQHSQVQVADSSDLRYLISSSQGIKAMVDDLIAGQKEHNITELSGQSSYLSISGGGDNGAFGAGLLTGWTERGDRPRFDLVTGVSTGALIAPFAFLGPSYDHVLKQVYTETSPDRIYKNRSLLSGLLEDGLADTTPLYQLISVYIDADFLKKVAYEYNARGRWLLVGTTNLDAGVPVVWNMGKIASLGTPEALELFRRVLLASASIPGAFPPVMFDVTLNGVTHHEMHVDGGVSAQVFLYPTVLAKRMKEANLVRRKDLSAYIIRNSRLDTGWQETDRATLTIVGRAISQLIQAQGMGDIYRIYQTTQNDQVKFNLAFIGPDFKQAHTKEFDTVYMKALYEYARQQSLKGYPWSHEPPGIDKTLDEDIATHADKAKRKK
jgi:predicted acylesterase/phospholipase RssA